MHGVKQELWLCDALDVPSLRSADGDGGDQSRHLQNNTSESRRQSD